MDPLPISLSAQALGDVLVVSPARSSTSPMAPTGLHRAHFAFMRAVLQGLDPVVSWRRYLAVVDERVDPRTVRATLQWVRGEFAAAALREHRPGTARLVLLDARRLLPGETLPSLEAFASDAGLDGFSQAEQMQAYTERFGDAATRQGQLQRLIGRQLEALRWLESLRSRPPRPEDPVGMWLQPRLALRLVEGGLPTLEALLRQVNGRGLHWHRGLRGIGAIKGERIVQWLRIQEVALGAAPGAHADAPPSRWSTEVRNTILAPGFGILPLEKLRLPASLDGHDGAFRAPRSGCTIEADDDHGAIACWLGPAPGQPGGRTAATHRSYRKEAERLLLWAALERHKPLSSLDRDDQAAYLQFLQDPQPAHRWCGSPAHGRWSPLWRPFAGPLGGASILHARRVLKALFAYLVQQGYLSRALFDEPLTRQRAPHNRPALAAPAPQPEPQPAIVTVPKDPASLRALLKALTVGWPAARLCDARLCDVAIDPAQGHWWWHATDGRPPVRLPDAAVAALRRQWQAQGWPGRPGVPVHPGWHLLGADPRAPRPRHRSPPRPGAGILPGTLRDQLRATTARSNR